MQNSAKLAGWRWLWVLACLWLTACDSGESVSDSGFSRSEGDASQNPIQVTATVGMVADLVRQVGGEQVQVTQICGPGVDPHLYKATRDDVQTMMNADMIFYCGLMLEGKMTDTLIKMARQKPVVAVTEILEPSILLEPEDFSGHYDPHVWMDVSAWSQCVQIVCDSLCELAPKSAEYFRQNASAYQQTLAELHAYGQQSIASIPETSRILVTSHDAFNYFGRAYGIEVVGVQGISTESEAGLQRINDLVDLLVQRNVQSVFVESSVPRKNIDALVEGARSKGHQVQVGEKELFSDAMGQQGSYEGTYLGMLDHNITLVTRGLGGTAPAGGFRGSLSP
ncbi:MAG: zinc ABC transporter substrate-binding protein [bacterium]|nr:zinc ABC transporter substrate-binding protein [bacterium]